MAIFNSYVKLPEGSSWLYVHPVAERQMLPKLGAQAQAPGEARGDSSHTRGASLSGRRNA